LDFINKKSKHENWIHVENKQFLMELKRITNIFTAENHPLPMLDGLLRGVEKLQACSKGAQPKPAKNNQHIDTW
jgi:hypothetical protein